MGFGQGFPTGRSILVRPPESVTSSLDDGVESAPVISSPPIATNNDGVEDVETISSPPIATNSDGVEDVETITLTTVVQVG